jgi:hypothetical protein
MSLPNVRPYQEALHREVQLRVLLAGVDPVRDADERHTWIPSGSAPNQRATSATWSSAKRQRHTQTASNRSICRV